MADQGIELRVESPAPLARYEPQELSVDELVERVKKVQEVASRVMVKDTHYGTIPGAGDRKVLLKAGAELLGLAFRLDPQFDIAEKTYEDGHLTIVIKCTLYHAPSGARMGSGLGSCSTKESKYAWRKGERLCPNCGKPAIIKGRPEYGGGWICFARKDGCGAKFKVGDQSIEGQATGRVPNPDLADAYNTVLKMATKRAHVAATLFVTGASEVFTQDIEERESELDDDEPALRKPGSGAAGPGTRISPHDLDPEEPEQGPPPTDQDVFQRLMKQLHELGQAIDNVKDYGEALTLKTILGTLGTPSELTREMQRARETRQIGGNDHKELSRQWQKNGRALNKRLEQLKPDALASFTDHEDGEPHDEMGKPL